MVEDKEMKLEEAMARLDEVVKQLSDEGRDLDSSLALYEEGVKLAYICNEKLNDAERRINILRVNPDGEVYEAPFGEGEATL